MQFRAAPPLQVRTDEELLAHVEAFLERTAAHGMTPTRFGVEAMREGGLVKSLREGRSLSVRNMDRVLSYIERWRPDGAAPDTASEWPLASPGNGHDLSGRETASEPEASSPPFAAGGGFPPTSSKACPTCDAPATPTSPARSSPGLQDAEAA